MKTLLCSLLSLYAINAFSLSWDWLKTRDQKAQQLMQHQQFEQAARLFTQPQWQAAANYRHQQYAQAVKLYQGLKDEQSLYNLGNALAQMGQYEKAIQAYDHALALNPQNEDAVFNKNLVKELLKQQQQSSKQENKENKGSGKNSDDKASANNKNDPKNQASSQQKSSQNKPGQPNTSPTTTKEQPSPEHTFSSKEADKINKGSKQEKNLAKDQWLRLIPDEPGGLLREKFLRDYLRREKGWYR